ncbi:MAG: 2-oxo acid dehydrogenase subunit E2 [Acidimicrobiales bacterium]
MSDPAETGDDWSRLRPAAAHMAKVMGAAADTPIAAQWIDVDVSGARRLLAGDETELTLGSVFLWAAAASAWDVDALWYEYDLATLKRRRRDRLGVAMAVATDRGLVVPTIWFSDQPDLSTTAAALRETVQRARDGKLDTDDRRVGSLAVTSIGGLGIDGGLPLMRPGELAICGFSSVKPRPVVVDGELAIRETTVLTGTLDHRWVDGMSLAGMLVASRDRIESLDAEGVGTAHDGKEKDQ